MSRAADVIDGALEVAVAPSFTRIGPAVRSRLDHWRPVDSYDLAGRVVVITGATSGLGMAAATTLAADGATIVLLARNTAKAEGVRDDILRHGAPGGGDVVTGEMGDLESVRAAATTIAATHERIDVLVHNAGALDATYGTSAQGIEQTVASQVVGPFLLTTLLLGRLRASAPSRVLWVSSGGMYSQPLAVDQLEMSPSDYNGTTAYARAKRAQVTLVEIWADRLRDDGVVMHSMHPGWADTPGVQKSLPTFRRIVGPLLRSPAEGADTLVWLSADDGAPLARTGRFWLDRRPRSIHKTKASREADTVAERRRLWDWCVERSGVEPD